MILKDYLESTIEEKLNYFFSTLSVTNRTPEYYVNWDKVRRETKVYELELHTLNYLIGKEDIYNEALGLFQKQPQLLKAIPSLIASREKVLDILFFDEDDIMNFYQLDFKNIDTDQLGKYVDFMKEAGLLEFLQNDANRSLVDYVYGVEAGLDSNARKNRSGTTMESILERNVEKVCEEYGLSYKAQATAKFIKNTWGIEVPVDKSERRFDIAVYSEEKHKVWLVETNYYGGGGSKLKSVSGEFAELSKLIQTAKDNIIFSWVTDGQGWHTARLPLSEAFSQIDNIFNLEKLKKGYLFELFK